MKYCQHCGKELLDDALICIGCGRVVQAQTSVELSIEKEKQEHESEGVLQQAQNTVVSKDNKWVVRLFSYFFSILASVLYVCSRSLNVALQYSQNSHRIYTGNYYTTVYDSYVSNINVYTKFNIAMLISSLVILALSAILAITDIALTGVDVSRRKVSTSKL
ncbi:MAG: zinc-ribbon domain-containing protein, partial [Clostridia bacterium]|nr:zinc-ribbon domain-containing protein [Clostridia bacterium]